MHKAGTGLVQADTTMFRVVDMDLGRRKTSAERHADCGVGSKNMMAMRNIEANRIPNRVMLMQMVIWYGRSPWKWLFSEVRGALIQLVAPPVMTGVALVKYEPMGRKKHAEGPENKLMGRNELIAKHIEEITGEHRSRKQVSSHIQVLKPWVKDDPESRSPQAVTVPSTLIFL